MNYKYILTAILIVAAFSGTASAWLTGYDYRMSITVDNGGASNLSYYQFNFTNDTNVLVAAGNMQASGADCRITDASDNLLPFWNETPFNATGTEIWVNATTLAVGDNTFYMYYGNAGASSVANGTNAFELFDDFEYAEPAFIQEDVDTDGTNNGGGMAVEMPNGTIWLFYQQYTGEGWNCDGKILYRTSSDDGVTWSSATIFYNTSGHWDAEPFTYKEGDTVYVFWTILNGPNGNESDLYMRKTTDNGSTWSSPVKIWGDGGVNEKINTVINIIKITDTYIISMYYEYAASPEEYRGYCIRATDIEGTWTKGDDVSIPGTRGVMEPSIVELSNGSIYMDIRCEGGHRYKAISSDNGATWDSTSETTINSPQSKGGVSRLSNGHLVMVWNNVYSTTEDPRYPLTVGISTDDFATFDAVKNITTETGSNSLTQLSPPQELSSGYIIFPYFHYRSSSGAAHLDVARFTESELSVQGNPSDNGWTDYTGHAQTSTNKHKRGSRSLFLDASSNEHIYRARSGAQIIEFDYYDLDSTNDSQDLMEFDALMEWNMTIGTNKDTVLGNYIRGIPAGWQDTGIARSVGWHHVIVEFDGSVFNIWFDGTKIVDSVAETLENIFFSSTDSVGYSEDFYVDSVRARQYASPEPAATLGAEETGGGGCGAYNITLPLGWSIIGWTNPTASTAHAMGTSIGGNCSFVGEFNSTTMSMVYHHMTVPAENNFAIERGYGYWVLTSAETVWERDS